MFDVRLRDKLLFEDSHFTYSRRYFWAYNTLGVINEGIKSMRAAYLTTFTKDFWAGRHPTLWPYPQSHPQQPNPPNPNSSTNPDFDEEEDEALTSAKEQYLARMDVLRQELESAVAELQVMHDKNEATRTEIRSLREQLFSGSSVKESRRAIEQGDNIKILTSVSMVFLPLTFVVVSKRTTTSESPLSPCHPHITLCYLGLLSCWAVGVWLGRQPGGMGCANSSYVRVQGVFGITTFDVSVTDWRFPVTLVSVCIPFFILILVLQTRAAMDLVRKCGLVLERYLRRAFSFVGGGTGGGTGGGDRRHQYSYSYYHHHHASPVNHTGGGGNNSTALGGGVGGAGGKQGDTGREGKVKWRRRLRMARAARRERAVGGGTVRRTNSMVHSHGVGRGENGVWATGWGTGRWDWRWPWRRREDESTRQKDSNV
jgi:hypothetical protein